MIRYPLSKADLESKIDNAVADWRQRASNLTQANLAAASLIKKSSIWSDIKPVYMRIQHNKCLYCERPLAGEVAGKTEQDVEHYRPKGRVSAWPKAASRLSYAFATGTAQAKGYFWLAFEHQNYAASCKPCNGTRKSDAFPILGTRGNATMTLAALNQAERPLLIFPFGDWGDDPSGLIRFEGIVAVPVRSSGLAYQRARVTIDFFGLNDREELWEDRLRVIQSLFANVEVRQTTSFAERRAAAERAIEDAISDAGAQALCARNFLALLETDFQLAWRYYVEAENFVRTKRQERQG